MKIFNTMSTQKENLVTQNKKQVMIYACGPTVYNYIHIGNARPLCVFDTLRRYLEYIGYDVKFVQNYTDIDDKIIKKANSEGTSYDKIAKKFIGEYEKDAKALNLKDGAIHPKATENIGQIIKFISGLVEKGYAYSSPSGDVYFRSKKFKEYGKLSHQPIEQLEAGARISVGEQKEDATDFALWKSAKPGEPYWDSPWGKGRPGWHIECSAMAKEYLADTIDIHCGGQDLIFPHHENEIAQSECLNGCTFANYWMHNGYINIDNKKMSKSLGNFFTVREIGEKYGFEPIRYMMLASHYRSPISFSEDLIKQAVSALERLYNCRENLQFLIKNCEAKNNGKDEKEKEENKVFHKQEPDISANANNLLSDEKVTDGKKGIEEKEETKIFSEFKAKFCMAMDDDFNTADALATIFNLVKEINRMVSQTVKPSKDVLSEALNTLVELTSVLGLLYKEDNGEKNSADNEEIELLISRRQQARKDKNWGEADSIRDKLKELNVVVEDTPEGVKWHFER